ncbi:glycoside hydrolase family 32 protein [Corynebacterium uberis]|uniref:glycoside hydrolase family 32 protein n=1 Tax=Corynebacterium uberis TaxID=2883169 RepID=UPI001D0BA69D|nr:glycoside hydrolase family 32 protein [Corynebacterium uberis]UDL72950.1 glycoside hydrolase family 32 protein [Corynebacterium uberis]
MASTHYRPVFHVSPPLGRLNDPNGLFLGDNGDLHVFYQHDPYFPHAAKRTGWGHVVIPLAGGQAGIPRHLPDALVPDRDYDSHGCYSGCAVRPAANQHHGSDTPHEPIRLFYTGNHKSDTGRVATQNVVVVDDPDGPLGGTYTKAPTNPVIADRAPGTTPHFRDPHVSADPQTPGAWRMVLGAQLGQGEGGEGAGTGAIALYRSDDLDSWDFAGMLSFDTSQATPGDAPDLVPGGYMWECPNLVRLRDEATGQDQDVLVLCPQGLEEVEEMDPDHPDVMFTHYASSDQCGYLVGRLEGTTFHVTRGFSELDVGHEFYAPQLLGTGDGAALMLGWMGLPGQDDKPTLAEGWVHMLTCVRRVTLRDGWLYQRPLVPEQCPRWRGQLGERDVDKQLVDAAGAPVVRISYDAQAHALSIARRGGGPGLDRGDGNSWDTRTVRVPRGDVEIIVDGAAVEVFAGDGAVSAALQAYPLIDIAEFNKKDEH